MFEYENLRIPRKSKFDDVLFLALKKSFFYFRELIKPKTKSKFMF